MSERHAVPHMERLFLLTLFVACQSIGVDAATTDRMTPEERVKAGKALWEEKCRTVAGEKIYRKVQNVEGLLLMKVRPMRGDSQLADRDWPGAAFAREAPGEEYIKNFLGYEYGFSTLENKSIPVTPQYRGTISTDRLPGGLPGYRWAEVVDEKDGKRYRYTGANKVVGRMDVNAPNVKFNLERNPKFDLNIYGYVLDKAPAHGSSPRYGVTYEDHVIPEDRALGVASSTIKVLDLKTKEVLGEMTRYAWSPGTPSRTNPSPWLTAYRCPDQAWTGADTRKFVDQILIPSKEK